MIRRAITEAFNTWSEVIPLNFTEVTTAGDIKISFQSKDHGNCPPFDGPGQVLAHATEPNGNPSFVHFDDEEYWVYRNENKLRRYPFTDLLNVAIHEIGHTLGLDHSEADDAIMNAQYNYPFDRYGRYIGGTLREDDIRRIQQLYGSRHSGERATTTAPPHFTTWYWGPWFGGEIPDYN
uniref:ZnMc domain-containing protein n=1 Tax=Syphacia muris TaxID=451379 RepID=A0A0N5AX08_9BILA